ncbi:hypothetical protein KI387_034622 [Taxus chinensis]|uniref:Uncharacterized protein n=1 Tax=Taxus chinensis TaxID=29808 RepID=A0AA38BVH4_TAXCH|nr:hypothetical protein KI387_034622 [Taxus chinensis]
MTAHEAAIEGLAGIARETQLISSDRVGQYLQRRDTSSGGGSSTSDARSEVYARASLISPDDFELVTDPAQARRLGRIMATDLLRAYEVIARHCSIPLLGVLDFIEQSGSVSSSQGTTAAATDRLPIAGIVTPDVQHISVPASAPVCGASQPTPSTRVTYTQLLTEHNMDLDVPGLSQLGLVGDIFAGVEVVDDNPIHLETHSAEGSTGQRSTHSVDTPNIRPGTDTEGAAERSEGSGTRPNNATHTPLPAAFIPEAESSPVPAGSKCKRIEPSASSIDRFHSRARGEIKFLSVPPVDVLQTLERFVEASNRHFAALESRLDIFASTLHVLASSQSPNAASTPAVGALVSPNVASNPVVNAHTVGCAPSPSKAPTLVAFGASNAHVGNLSLAPDTSNKAVPTAILSLAPDASNKAVPAAVPSETVGTFSEHVHAIPEVVNNLHQTSTAVNTSNIVPNADMTDVPLLNVETPAKPSSNFPVQIQVLVNKAFAEFKRLSLISEPSKDFLIKLQGFKSSGILPKNLHVKAPKISVNDLESNAFLSLKLNSIQVDANYLFLDAYIDALTKEHENHDSTNLQSVENFDSTLLGACVAIKHLPLLGQFSIASDDWHSAATPEFHSLCNNFQIDHSLKRATRKQAESIRQQS